MLTGKELKSFVKDLDDDAIIVINGIVAIGLSITCGKIYDNYTNTEFKENIKGKQKALMFHKWTEMSDGQWYITKI
jgi:hypothetical protein